MKHSDEPSKMQADDEPIIQPSKIEKYFDEKGKREIDIEFGGWTGHYSLTAKDIIDMMLDLKIGLK